MFLMIALTLAAAACPSTSPSRGPTDEIRFAVGGPAVPGHPHRAGRDRRGPGGRPRYAVGPRSRSRRSTLGFALVVLGRSPCAGAFAVAGAAGLRAAGAAAGPDDPAASLQPRAARPRWLAAHRLGLRPAGRVDGRVPLAIPLVVYVVSYIPWALRGQQGDRRGLAGREPHRAQRDADRAHRADVPLPQHADASRTRRRSPWWAWPLDLKPVWFYQGGFANGDRGVHLRRRQHRHLVAGHPGHGRSPPTRRSSGAASRWR